MRTRAPLLLALCLLGCGNEVDSELMAGQVARLNRDLALLAERVAAVEKQTGAQPAPPGDVPPAPSGQARVTAGAPALPPASVPDVLEAHVITSVEGGAVRIGDAELRGPALAARLAEHAGKGPGARLAIHIAASTPAAQLAEVLELARQSGIREISVVTTLP